MRTPSSVNSLGIRGPNGSDTLGEELLNLPRAAWDVLFARIHGLLVHRGELSGSLVLQGAEEVSHVEAVGCRVRHGKARLVDLDAAFRSGRFPTGLLAATERWMGMPVVARKTIAERQAAVWNEACTRWHEVIDAVPRGDDEFEQARDALHRWVSSNPTWIRSRWNEDAAQAETALRFALTGGLVAPGIDRVASTQPLPVFATTVMGDPHGFDHDRLAGRWLMATLAIRFLGADDGIAARTAEERAAILDAAGLATDGVSSRIVTLGLEGSHPLLAAARATHLPLTLTALHLEAIETMHAVDGVCFVLENPPPFTMIYRALQDSGASRWPTVLCTAGQFGVVAARCLDGLVRTGARLHYSGDFDGGGLRIADRLAARYGDAFVPWQMDRAAYARVRRSETPRAYGGVEDQAALGDTIGLAWSELRRDLTRAIAAGGPAYQEALTDALIHDVLAAIRQ